MATASDSGASGRTETTGVDMMWRTVIPRQ
jgi:hypothetical protein